MLGNMYWITLHWRGMMTLWRVTPVVRMRWLHGDMVYMVLDDTMESDTSGEEDMMTYCC